MKRLNWGIIGTGKIANEFAQSFNNNNSMLMGVASRSKKKADEFKKKYEIKMAYGDYQDLLNDANIDVIYIATPHNTHYEYISKAIDKGKHVVSEKVIVTDSSQLKKLIDKSKEKNVYLFEAMTIHYMPIYEEIKKFIIDKNLGKPKMIQVNFGSFKTRNQSSYFFNKDLAGGALFDIGVYALNFARFFMTSTPYKVKTIGYINDYEVDEASGIVLKNDNNEIATITLSFRAKLPKTGIVAFEKGYFTVYNYPRSDYATFTTVDGEMSTISVGDSLKGLMYEVENISKIISEQSENIYLQHTEDVINIMDSVREQWGLKYPFEDLEKTDRVIYVTYDQRPKVRINEGNLITEYPIIVAEINKKLNEKSNQVIMFELYPGVSYSILEENIIKKLNADKIICSDSYFISENEMNKKIEDTLTEDKVFGIMSHYNYYDFHSKNISNKIKHDIENDSKPTVIYGVGASSIYENYDLLIYADLPRWEIQKRQRAGISNWKANNKDASNKEKYKRGYFFEWRVADRQKKRVFEKIDYLLETVDNDNPKLINGNDYKNALEKISHRPFRVVPYFDKSVWGGQWMKRKFDLEEDIINYGWAFDGVPEENSILLEFDEGSLEIPATNLVFSYPENILGGKICSRYGTEFPIRFDLLDTVEGGHLSLQVHPTSQYIFDKFGMRYTQDESYYILDAKENSYIYLGVKDGIDKENMIRDLERANIENNYIFPADKYINKIQVKKHDHYSIPAGTVHCSGPDTVVLEISATPNIFTFKLWDWDRLDLNGNPRPIHLEHGIENIDFTRNATWVSENLCNRFLPNETMNDSSQVTGLHDLEDIKTVRHWITNEMILNTNKSVNVLNLIEGEEVVIRSLDNSFQDLTIHYGETFIVPASIKEYTILNKSINSKVGILQAYIKN